ncbi:augmin complex subunit dgt4-like [Drosophila serrata]|uniref:augmin complex subunit dgt4-like n=1 Tax=Drosophila serrata TaxID=7274 RepID=UPI000A1D36C3|nr:augmin complex subunit dgt4-like [Drosophila serrata]KAH8388671.1 hypothetical protein KR200_007387 [Drosophila serrata]
MDISTPPTPTRAPRATSTVMPADSGMEDIQRLLNLEARCRFQEDAQNVQRQVQDKARDWLDAKYEYQQEYSRLARLINCIGMRVAIDTRSTSLDEEKLKQTLKMINNLRTRIASDLRPASLDASVVVHCQQQLDTVHKPRFQLSRQKREFAEIQKALQELRTSVDALENGLELHTMQAMDQMVTELLPARRSDE